MIPTSLSACDAFQTFRCFGASAAVARAVSGAIATLILLLLCCGAASAQPLSIVDIRGRTVTVPGTVTRMTIDDSRYLIALALITPDPVGPIAAWPRDIHRLGKVGYDRFVGKFPALAGLPRVAASGGSFDMESLLAVAPQVAIFSLNGGGPTEAQIGQLETAGIKVVYVDFFINPLKNLDASLAILGKLIGRSTEAQAFSAFRQERLKRIVDKVSGIPAQQIPLVFIEAHAGITADCCNVPGRGNIGDYVQLVGGHNIGADVISNAYGKLNLEYIIERNPSVYIATGGPHLEKSGGLVIGPEYSVERSRASLKAMAARPGIANIQAVKNGNVHGFAHQLINSPLDILAVEVFAKWIHPDAFADLDPDATLALLNSRFLAVPQTGTYWVSMK